MSRRLTPRRVVHGEAVFAREWTVPSRQEFGLPHFGDPSHFIEYDEESFRVELADAGLAVTELIPIWGEIWATTEPAGR